MIYEILLSILKDQSRIQGVKPIGIYLSPDLAEKLQRERERNGLPIQCYQCRWVETRACPDSHIGILFSNKAYLQFRVNIDDTAA